MSQKFASRLVGTMQNFLRIGKTGPRLKNNSGVLALRNAADSADADLTAAAGTFSGALSCPGAGTGAERFGSGAAAAGNSAVAIGNAASASAAGAIAVGAGATNATANSVLFGSSSSAVNLLTFGGDAAAPSAVTLRPQSAAGTNVAGAALNLAGGTGTGSAAGGDVVLQTGPAGSSGAGVNSLTNSLTVKGTDGSVVVSTGSTTGQTVLRLRTRGSGGRPLIMFDKDNGTDLGFVGFPIGGSNTMFLINEANDSLCLGSNNSTKMTITGTDVTTGVPLNVNGALYVSTVASVGTTDTSLGPFTVLKNQNATTYLTIINGNANAAAHSALRIFSGGAGGGDSLISFFSSGVLEWAIGTDTSDSSKFKIASSSALDSNTLVTITPTGSVGVGASPLAKFHVQGTTYGPLFLYGSGEDVYVRTGKDNGTVYVQDSNIGDTVIGNNALTVKGTGSNNNVIVGGAALATAATIGFLWIPSCPGTPTGSPTSPYANAAALVVDTSGSKLWVRVGGTWKSTALT